MSEKVYASLLRLYPSHFRERYGIEALQLFRDRSREEQGFFPALRLWFDLLADLLLSLPREYCHPAPSLTIASPQQNLDSLPSFNALENRPPHFSALLLGAILSLVALSAASALIRPSDHPQFPCLLCSQIFRNASAQAASLDTAERHHVVEQAVANLKQHYFDRALAEKIADALLIHEKNGDDNAAPEGETFANLLTRQMRDASHDMHLAMEYSPNPLPENPPVQTPGDLARFRKAMLDQNCMFKKAELLRHNIGYVKLDFFADASICASIATHAMSAINGADAIIFDLRENTGGFPEMVSLLAGYLFDHPEYMYSPRGAPTVDSWTRSPVPGNRLADKPVYVLTSAATWSGAEQFSYDLKMLKRATLVGETTRGGAHAGAFHRLDDHFGMGIPEEKTINPFGASDWEGTGVEPHVKVKAADALETAMQLALTKSRKP